MSTLRDILTTRLTATGPITLAEYMTEALFHPNHGYYTSNIPFGAEGDFVTAPEISQMFGEVLGLCLAQTWMDQGCPKGVLAELGPGRGTLMEDILRATRSVPGLHSSLELHLVETSPRLAKEQTARLPVKQIHKRASDIPEAPLFVIANEFFDALPIRQFVRDAKGWRERMIGTNEKSELTFGLSSPSPISALDDRLDDTRDGDIVEICPALPSIISEIGNRIARFGGSAVFIDYGDWRSLGDTFQAMQQHKAVDPLADPGNADLTAHVDFEAIALAAGFAKYTRLTTQGTFLERLGITHRAQALAERLTGTALDNHIAAHRRLTHPAEMGELFKVIGLYPGNQIPPPALEP